jgi:hypothetical protein
MACYDTEPYLCTYDSGGGKDYSSLSTWGTDTDNDLSGYTGPVILDCYDSQSHNDPGSIYAATNTSTTAYRWIRSSPNCTVPFSGRAGTGAYFYRSTTTGFTFELKESYCMVSEIEASLPSLDNGSTYYCFEISGTNVNGAKVVNCIAHDSVNVGAGGAAGFSCRVGSSSGLPVSFIYNCIAYDNDGNGFYNYSFYCSGSGCINAILNCTSIGNTYGFQGVSTGANSYGYAFSCYAANNTTSDFNDASGKWAADNPGWNASSDETSDLYGQVSTNYKFNLDLTTSNLDSDYLPTSATNLYGAGGSGDNYGRNPYDDFSGAITDFDDWLKNDQSGDSRSKLDIQGTSRPTPDTADVSWAIGAAEYVSPSTLSSNSFDNWKDGSPIVEPDGDGSFDDWKDGSPFVESSTNPTLFETDFTEAGAEDDWTDIWETTNFSHSVGTSSSEAQVGSKNLAIDLVTLNGRGCATYDPPGASLTDCEVLTLLNLADVFWSTSSCTIYLRASGSQSSETGYYLGLFGSSSDRIMFVKYVSGSATTLEDLTGWNSISTTSQPVWVRFKVVGYDFYAKIWNYDSIEPAEWSMISSDPGSSIASGAVGLGRNVETSGHPVHYEYFAVDTSGTTIPVPDLTAGTRLDQLSPLNKFSTTYEWSGTGVYVVPQKVPSGLNGKYVKTVSLYADTAGTSARIALYKGTDDTTPDGASLVEDFGEFTSGTSGAYLDIQLTESCQVSTDDILWICFKNDGTGTAWGFVYVYNDASPFSMPNDVCNATGRHNISAGVSSDPSVAWPASFSGITSSAGDTFYAVKVLFDDAEPGATTTTTTTISTTSTTVVPTFFETDFTEASPLDDWTEIWNTSGFTTSVNTSSQTAQVGSKNLYVAQTTTSQRSAIVWDGSSGPGTVTDAEVLCLVSVGDNIYNYDTPFRIHVRTGGSTGSEDGYLLTIGGGSTDAIGIFKYVAGAAPLVTGGSADIQLFSNSSQFWVRFRVIGTSLKAKVWLYYYAEPEEWCLDVTDSDHTSGTLGLGIYTQYAHFYCEYFAVDTSGGTVPVPTLTSGELIDCLSTNLMVTSTYSSINYVRLVGYPIPDSLDGKYIKEIKFYCTAWYDNVRFAVYVNSDETDPSNGATLVEDLGVITAVDNSWNTIALTESYQVSYGDVVWIGYKGDDANSRIVYSDKKGDAMDQLCNDTGRYDISSGVSTDETVAWPSDISGISGSTGDYWYLLPVYFQDGPLDATTTTTTTISTTSTTDGGGPPPGPGTGNENTVIVIATI